MNRFENNLKNMQLRGGFTLTPGMLRRLFFVILLAGVVTRLIALGNYPFHHDESLDAWFSLRFLDGNYAGYNPIYHGPLRFYITAGFFWLFGESDFTARLLAALSGILLLGFPWHWRKHLGPVGTISASSLLLISPSMLYFSRFGREDMFFLLATTVFVAALFGFLNEPKWWHPTALLSSLVTGMAIKESVLLMIFLFGVFLLLFVIQENLVASVKNNYSSTEHRDHIFFIRRWTLLLGLISFLGVFLWVGNSGGGRTIGKLGLYICLFLIIVLATSYRTLKSNQDIIQLPIVRSFRTPTLSQWILSVLISATLFVALFSQFFTRFSGPETAAAPNSALRNGLTAGFNYWVGQQKDGFRGDSRWQYYLTLLSAYEWLILFLAVLGIWRVFRRPNLFGQLIIWWAGGTLIMYSWASERMPWLVIHPLFPFAILAGLGFQIVYQKNKESKFRRTLSMIFGIFLIFSATQSLLTAYTRGSEPQELFVQAGQATPEVESWSKQLFDLDRAHFAETGEHLNVVIDSDVYWPYGWYLRDFPTSTYAVIEGDLFPELQESPDLLILPYWDVGKIELQIAGYEIFPYNHRWWWVPDFDTGASDISQFPGIVSRWGKWFWSREPWADIDSSLSQCPASLSGNVFVKKSVIQEAQNYGVWNNPQDTKIPIYEGECKNVSFSR